MFQLMQSGTDANTGKPIFDLRGLRPEWPAG